jgi:hypothetical protein
MECGSDRASPPQKKTVLIADDNTDAAILLQSSPLGQVYDRNRAHGPRDKLEKCSPVGILTGWDLKTIEPLVAGLSPKFLLEKPVLAQKIMEVLDEVLGG